MPDIFPAGGIQRNSETLRHEEKVPACATAESRVGVWYRPQGSVRRTIGEIKNLLASVGEIKDLLASVLEVRRASHA